jgi:hypothetical protein
MHQLVALLNVISFVKNITWFPKLYITVKLIMESSSLFQKLCRG